MLICSSISYLESITLNPTRSSLSPAVPGSILAQGAAAGSPAPPSDRGELAVIPLIALHNSTPHKKNAGTTRGSTRPLPLAKKKVLARAITQPHHQLKGINADQQ